MVGKQVSPDKTSSSLTLEGLVPKDNFYRRLKSMLDLTFLYSAVEPCYGKCGQQSIDPMVFFKLLLVGHLENLVSDRAIIRTSQLRLDILYFLDYSLGQPLPWHSTLSRTRQRLPESLFEACFQRILAVCAEAGMVSGDTQAIDSALVAANASLDNLKDKSLADWSVEKNADPVVLPPDPYEVAFKRVVNPNKVVRNNRTHQSKTDLEARLAQKPGKPFRLYYLSSLAVDTAHHVIPHIQADYADEKDSRHLLAVADETATTLKGVGLPVQRILADGGFSSGENYAVLEDRQIEAYIASNGVYKTDKPSFTYEEGRDEYICAQGKSLRYHETRMASGYAKRYYYAKLSDCGHCPLKAACCGKRKYKYLTTTAFRNPFERMLVRLESGQGRRMKKLRSSTVEPVFGSLITYYGMRRTNTRGRSAAHKVMLLAATAYNLHQLVAFAGGPKVKVKALTEPLQQCLYFFVQVEVRLLATLLEQYSVVQHPPSVL